MKIRASEAFKLLTEPRTKAAKDAGELSETTKTFIQDVWLRDEFGYNEPVVTNPMLKGLMCEQDSMKLVQKFVSEKEFRIKNTKHFSKDYFTGTPDIILKSGVVEDIKTSWTIKTFFNAELEKSYYVQLQVYMYLTGCKKARLIYALVNTPTELILEEEKRFFWKYGADDENPHYIKAQTDVYNMHTAGDKLPDGKRLKVYEFDYDESLIETLIEKAMMAEVYYNSLTF